MNKIILLLNTIKFLKMQQIKYRIYYVLRKKYRKIFKFSYPIKKYNFFKAISLFFSIYSPTSYYKNGFKFLNKDKKFIDKVDWNFSEYGKLWLYNLTYFDFLQQENISKNDGLNLINDFIYSSENIIDGMMPFPISLRGINWVKFLTYHNINDEKINNSLYTQYYILLDNLEYHILGNHLLENGFSLLFGAYYFDDDTLHVKAKEILSAELNEQILEDGAHFELSPMYHQIMLFRVLDSINLLQNNFQKRDEEFLIFLNQKALLMLGWLSSITFKNGDMPLLNDSTNAIAPTAKELFEYASRLDIEVVAVELKESGYRKFDSEKYECIIDIGNIGPDYIPGHAHADTFNFVVQVDDKPFIVDTGLSTYETNDKRIRERSTSSHNTVEINGKNQSEVWGGFRVANRAKIVDIKEYDNTVEATHDGYKKEGILHTRKWKFEEDKITVEDSLSKAADAIARIHFHPNITKNEILEKIVVKNLELNFGKYKYSPAFNTNVNAIVLEIQFKENLKMEIKI